MIGLFCKRAYKRDCILQKRPGILRSLLTVATPCVLIWLLLLIAITYERVMLHSYNFFFAFSTYEWVISRILMWHVTRIINELCPHAWISHVTHMNVARHTYEWSRTYKSSVSIWLSPVTCIMGHVTHLNQSYHTCAGVWEMCSLYQFYASFAEYSLFYRALLQKRPISHITHAQVDVARMGALHERGYGCHMFCIPGECA